MGDVKGSLLDQLAPAHAPPPPGLWPLAPGWWLLAVLIAVIALAIVFWWRKPASPATARRIRRAALLELQMLEATASDDTSLARGLEHLLRRYAMARFGAESVARLSGEPWIAFVASHGGEALQGEAGRALLRAAYGGKAAGSREPWLSAARGFLSSRA